MSSRAPRLTRAVSGDVIKKPSASAEKLKSEEESIFPLDRKSKKDIPNDGGNQTTIDSSVGLAGVGTDKTYGTGCLVCGKHENEHQILLCERCDGEYHIYCLKPPLAQIPSDEWFCDNCSPDLSDDGLEIQVAALPPHITHRYGEVVWAQGGVGYGWWPSILYDPRRSFGKARMEARKNLQKHLAFFFRCPEAPFVVLPDRQLKHWDVGLSLDFHMGKTAKAHSKQRYQCFREALSVAMLAMDLSRHQRLQTNWELGPGIPSVAPLKSPSKKPIPSTMETVSDQESIPVTPNQRGEDEENIVVEDPVTSSTKRKRGRPPKPKSDGDSDTKDSAEITPKRPKPTGKSDDDSDNKDSADVTPKRKRGRPRKDGSNSSGSPSTIESSLEVETNKNKTDAVQTASFDNPTLHRKMPAKKSASQKNANNNDNKNKVKPIPSEEKPASSEELVCRIVLRSVSISSSYSDEKGKYLDTVVGFVVLPSKTITTFADARRVIGEDLGSEVRFPPRWKFYVPNLGPVSRKQEYSFALYRILKNSADAPDAVGKGTYQDPVQLLIQEE